MHRAKKHPGVLFRHAIGDIRSARASGRLTEQRQPPSDAQRQGLLDSNPPRRYDTDEITPTDCPNPMPTELSDLERPRDLPRGTLTLDRDARFFATRRTLADRLRNQRTKTHLVPNELFHPRPPCDLVVRRGNLRVSKLLADGREVTCAVLQAGAVCRVRTEESEPHGDHSGSPLYNLGHTVLMALGETEIWTLPAGILDTD